ncbi:MAG TPA: hypothetical protein VHE55_14615 [Fimbriimonadaceae bacterium]|nr:hypothetical protein [Fimbriimonadaceae bacterium]
MDRFRRSPHGEDVLRGEPGQETLADHLFEGAPGYQPASSEKKQALVELSLEALAQLSYLAVDSVEHGDAICIRLTSDGTHPIEIVQAEIRAAWRAGVVRTRTSLHVVRQTPDGFHFRFAIHDDGAFLTGVYEVVARTSETR